MDMSKIGGLLGAVAPTIATALGGPVAGMAVRALSNALFDHPDAPMKEIESALSTASPDQLAAIKKVDADFKVQMKSLDIDLQRIAADDRKDARAYAVLSRDITPKLLAIAVVAMWGIVQYSMLHNVVDGSMRELISRLLGTLDSAVFLVLSYYFGSAYKEDKK